MERVRTKRTKDCSQSKKHPNCQRGHRYSQHSGCNSFRGHSTKGLGKSEELKKLNTELEPFIADGDLENEYQSVIEYEEETTHTLSILQTRAVQLHSGEPARPSTSAISSRSEERRRSGVELQKLQLQFFKGELAEWQSFWQQLKCAVHENEEISSGEKFQYLKTLVSELTRASIAGLQVTDACYNDATEILSGQFGDYTGESSKTILKSFECFQVSHTQATSKVWGDFTTWCKPTSMVFMDLVSAQTATRPCWWTQSSRLFHLKLW